MVTETGTYDEEEQEEVVRVPYVNNILQSIISNVEVYINNQQIYNSNGLYTHKSYISNNFKAVISEYKGILHCEGYDYEQDPQDISNRLPDHFFYKENETAKETVSSCMANRGLTFSQLLNCCIQIRKLDCD